MTYSLNEIEALSKRAARGAGLPWGVAEDASKAVRWLETRGLPGSAQLAAVLTVFDGVPRQEICPVSLEGSWHARSGVLCPISCGAALSDTVAGTAQGQRIEMDSVSHPLLLVPFAAQAVDGSAGMMALAWGQVQILCHDDGMEILDPKNQARDGTPVLVQCIKLAQKDLAPLQNVQRVVSDENTIATLYAFADRTLAPATEESRAKGAGAGVSDE